MHGIETFVTVANRSGTRRMAIATREEISASVTASNARDKQRRMHHRDHCCKHVDALEDMHNQE
jgi:stage III sporulation protein SpoIIIAA